MLAATKTDIKLLLVPISFLLLRIWSTVVDAFAFYTDNESFRCSLANAVLVFFMVSHSTVSQSDMRCSCGTLQPLHGSHRVEGTK